ncbi:MAG: hypothetical protein JW839_13400 [Candidatus Lokiarchaeota archaeon]|nr:hypothetical protein [Candidatus Lokiarchaeota archaeon]
MPHCKTCSSEYTVESSAPYEAAPGWDGECAACTRRRFDAYVKDYLLESFTVKELALRAEGYFALPRGTISSLDDRDAVADFVSISVLEQGLGEGGAAPTTPGDAIAQFVGYFDARVKQLEKALASRVRGSLTRMCLAGAIIVGIVSIIVILAGYLT